MKQYSLGLVMILLCTTNGTSQARRNQSRSTSSQSVTVRVSDELIQQMMHDDKGVKDCVDGAGINQVADNLSIKQVDLNKEGNSESIVKSTGSPGDIMKCFLCGPRLCNLWVYRSTENGYELLLNVEDVDSLFPLKTSTNGYRDLKVSYVSGNFGPFIAIYKFDGRHYQEAKQTRRRRK